MLSNRLPDLNDNNNNKNNKKNVLFAKVKSINSLIKKNMVIVNNNTTVKPVEVEKKESWNDMPTLVTDNELIRY